METFPHRIFPHKNRVKFLKCVKNAFVVFIAFLFIHYTSIESLAYETYFPLLSMHLYKFIHIMNGHITWHVEELLFLNLFFYEYINPYLVINIWSCFHIKFLNIQYNILQFCFFNSYAWLILEMVRLVGYLTIIDHIAVSSCHIKNIKFEVSNKTNFLYITVILRSQFR